MEQLPEPLIILAIIILEFFGCAVMIWIHGYFEGQGKPMLREISLGDVLTWSDWLVMAGLTTVLIWITFHLLI